MTNNNNVIYTGAVPPIQEFNEAHAHQLRIALVGGLRSGKTTVARHLASTYGLNRISFADKLKAESERMFGSITPLFDVTAPKPREVFVRYGQAMRSIYPDVFVAHARNAVNFALCNVTCPGVVIDDLRQPNEYEWLVDNGFIIIRITTDEETRVQRAASIGETVTAENLTDETESYIDKYFVDYDVHNNGTVEELYDTIDAIVEELRAGGEVEDVCPCCGGYLTAVDREGDSYA